MARINESSWVADLASWFGGWTRDLSNRSLLVCLAVGLFASLVVILRVPVVYDFLAYQDTRLEDQFFAWRQSLAGILSWRPQAAGDIVIVSVDDDSARRLGGYPPLPRQVYAELLRQLRDAGAAVVGFDMIFEGQSRLNGQSSREWKERLKGYLPAEALSGWKDDAAGDDRAFAAQIKKFGAVVLATNVEVTTNFFHGRSQILFNAPADQLLALVGDSSGLGNVVAEPDGDGVVRGASLVFDRFGPVSSYANSFALRMAEKRWRCHAIDDRQGKVYFADRVIPSRLKLNFLGPPGSFAAVPLWKALDWRRYQEGGSSAYGLPGNPFKGKVVLVGYHFYSAAAESVAGLPQSRSLPFNAFVTPVSTPERPLSGVELQANIVANILSASYLSEAAWWEQMLIVLFVSLLFARIFSGLHGRPWSMLLAVAAFGVVWLIDAFLCFVYLECLIPVMVPIFGVALPAYFLVLSDQNLFVFKERRKHTAVFRSLAPARLAEAIDRTQLGALKLEGGRASVTVLHCQIEGFDRIAEAESPEFALHMLNECLSSMIASVYDHSGILTRIWNYGILAVWGAPLPMPEESQARLAASCFVDIRRRLSGLSTLWQSERRASAQFLPLRCRFGINTGEAVCGRIGNERHTEYGAIGQTVDLTVSYQSITGRYGVDCIVGESTSALIARQFECRELDRIKLQPEARPMRIYELIAAKGKAPGALEEAVVLYRQGLAAMEERNFEEAERIFTAIVRIAPDDRPAGLMLERCRQYMEHPPAPTWDGATLVTSE